MATSSQEDVRQQLLDFYVVHNPSKIDAIDQIMIYYKDSYEYLFVKLREKYRDPAERSEDGWVLVDKEKHE